MGYSIFPIQIENYCHYAVLTLFDQARKSDFQDLCAGCGVGASQHFGNSELVTHRRFEPSIMASLLEVTENTWSEPFSIFFRFWWVLNPPQFHTFAVRFCNFCYFEVMFSNKKAEVKNLARYCISIPQISQVKNFFKGWCLYGSASQPKMSFLAGSIICPYFGDFDFMKKKRWKCTICTVL